MNDIFNSKNFTIVAAEKPHVDRSEGGHIVIFPKNKVSTRQDLSMELATELMKLTMVTGEAMSSVMNRHGVDIGRINYQDNGNWTVFKPGGPSLHIHIFGRAKSAKTQAYGQALNLPHIDDNPEFYHSLEPLSDEDIEEIGKEIATLLKTDKYING